MRPRILALILTLAAVLLPPAVLQGEKFANPILEGADPWVVHHEGTYYLVQSERQVGVSLRMSDCLTRWGDRQVIWRAPAEGMYSREVWAPKIYFIDGRWYIYTAASDGQNKNHLMWVFQSESDDPLGPYVNKGALYTGDHIETQEHNRWAIDGNTFVHEGERYFVWSGWPGTEDVQFLYIARMSNPWTIATNRVKLCHNADYLWERVAESPDERGLHEGPQMLQRDGRLLLIYSASASWLPTYKLGMLELAAGGDPMNPDDWFKHPEPVFQSTEETFGVGHNCFTTSPDGSEDWIVYHAKVDRAPGWRRMIFAQPFRWTDDGLPDFGRPVAAGELLPLPSGQPQRPRKQALEESFAGARLGSRWGYYGHHRLMAVRDGRLHLGRSEARDPAYIFRTGEKVVHHDFAADDVEVRTRLRFVAGQRDAGVLFRVQYPAVGYDAQHGYYAGLVLGTDLLVLGKTDGTNWQELVRAHTPLGLDQDYELAVRAEGPRIQVSLDGKMLIEHDDATYRRGSVGVRVVDTHAAFDRITARSLD